MKVERITSRIGGRVTGVDASKPLDAGTIAALAAWFLRGPILESLSRLRTDCEDQERNCEDA